MLSVRARSAEMERQVVSSPNLKAFSTCRHRATCSRVPIMSASHAVVMTSHYEGSPTFSFGKSKWRRFAVIEHSDPDRRISNQVNGFKVPDNTVAAYVEAILRVDRDIAQKMQRGRF